MKTPTDKKGGWEETFEDDFQNIQPGDVVEANGKQVVAVQIKEDDYGKTWVRFTCDCGDTPIHLRKDWLTSFCGGNKKHYFASEDGYEDNYPIDSFKVVKEEGQEILNAFGKMIWENNLGHLPTGEETFPNSDGEPTDEEDIIAERVAASVLSGTIPEDRILNLLTALELRGCNLSKEQKIMIIRMSEFVNDALNELEGIPPEEEDTPEMAAQRSLH